MMDISHHAFVDELTKIASMGYLPRALIGGGVGAAGGVGLGALTNRDLLTSGLVGAGVGGGAGAATKAVPSWLRGQASSVLEQMGPRATTQVAVVGKKPWTAGLEGVEALAQRLRAERMKIGTMPQEGRAAATKRVVEELTALEPSMVKQVLQQVGAVA